MSDVNDFRRRDRRTEAVSPGQLLREARERADWTQEDLAVELCLPLQRLRALEQDEHSCFGGGVFVRGYLRRAALVLGLRPQEVLDAYETCCDSTKPAEALPGLPPGHIPASGDSPRFGRFAAGVAIVAVVASTWWLLDPAIERERTASSGAARTPAPLEFTLPEEPRVEQPRPSLQVAATSNESERADEPSAAASEPEEQGVTLAPAVSLVEVQEPMLPRPGTVELRLEFTEDCWLEVTDAEDRRLAYHLHRAGDVVRLRGTAPVSLFLGNAEGVRLTMDGVAVPLRPARRDGTARLTLGGGAG